VFRESARRLPRSPSEGECAGGGERRLRQRVARQRCGLLPTHTTRRHSPRSVLATRLTSAKLPTMRCAPRRERALGTRPLSRRTLTTRAHGKRPSCARSRCCSPADTSRSHAASTTSVTVSAARYVCSLSPSTARYSRRNRRRRLLFAAARSLPPLAPHRDAPSLDRPPIVSAAGRRQRREARVRRGGEGVIRQRDKAEQRRRQERQQAQRKRATAASDDDDDDGRAAPEVDGPRA